MAVTQSNEKDRFVTQEESDTWNAMRKSWEADEFWNRKVQDSSGNISETKWLVSGDVAAYQDKQVAEQWVNRYNERYGTDLTVDETTKKIERSQWVQSEDVMRVDIPTAQSDITPTTTPTQKDTTTEKKQITDIAQFKEAGGTIEDLQNLIETRYGVSANIKDGAVMAEVNGELLEWQIDKWGNPRKISQGRVDDKYSVFARGNGIKTKKVNGQTYFEPQSMEEAIDLYNQFGGRVPLTKKSIETVKASKSYEYFSQYKGASSDVLFEGMKSGELGTGWETWEILSKMNGGQPTLEMIDAQQKFEQYTKLSNVNGENKVIYDLSQGKDTTTESVSDKVTSQIAARDAEYQKAVEQVFAWTDLSFSEFKSQNEELTRLNTEVNNIASQIDELNTDKRKIWDEIQKEFPWITRSSAIDIYSQRVDAIDDQLYVLQRDFNNKSSSLNYQESLAQSEYEYKLQRAENQYNMITTMYGIERGELVDQRAIARADEKLKEERAYLEEQRKQAIIDGDAERAKTMEYELAMFEEKSKIQQQFTDYQFTTPSSGVIAKMNPSTGEIEFIEAPSTGWAISSGVGTTTSSNFSQSDLWARTNRHNNPTAFTTSVAKQAGLVEWQDYVVGDSFPDNPNMFTAKIIGDPIEVTKKVIDNIGFYTQSWAPRWSYVWDIFEWNANDAWSNMDDSQKQSIIEQMYQRETDNAYENFGWFLWGTMWDSTTTTENINGVDVVLGSIGVPVAFERTIKNQIPATLLNSEIELESANDVIKNLYNSWMTQEDASAIFQGFEIREVEDIQLWANALQVIRSINNPPEWLLARVSANINTWWPSSAVNQLERAAYQDMWPEAVNKPNTKIQIDRLNEIRKEIERIWGPWVIWGKIENFKWKFKDSDVSTLKAMLWTYSTEKLADIFWASVTWWEDKKWEDITLSSDEQVQALYNKIDVFKNDEMRKLNAWRDWYLPEITEEELLNPQKLEELYRKKNFFWYQSQENITTQTQTTSTFDKLKQWTQGSSNDYESLIP